MRKTDIERTSASGVGSEGCIPSILKPLVMLSVADATPKSLANALSLD